MARKLLFVALAALLLVDIYAASVPRRSRRSGSSSDSSDDSSERSRPKQRQRGRAQQKPYRRPNVQEFVNQDYNRPLYVQAPRTQDYNRPLYVQAPRTQDYNRPLYVQAPETQDYNRPLYVQAPETQDYNRPLYVQAPETQDYNRPLYVQAPETQDYNRPLYVQAPETQDYNRPQYVQAPKTQDNNRPQYVQAQEYNGAEENIALQRGNRSKRSLSLETEAGLNVELNRSGKNRNNGVATGGSARSSLKVDQEIELLDIMKLLEMEIAMDAAKDASKKNNGNSRHSGVTVNTGHSNSNRMSLPSHSTKTSETHKSRAQIQDIKVGDYSSNSERKRDNKGREISSSKDLEVSKKAHVDGLDIEVDAQIAENVNNKHGSRRGHQVETSRVGDYSSNSERKRDNKGREITSSKDLEVSKKAHVDGLDIEVDDQVTETVGKHGSRPEHQVETSRIVSTHESISNNDRNDNRNGNRNRGVGFQIGNMAVSADLNRGLYGQVRNGVRERVDGGNTLRTRLADRTGNAMQSGIDATVRGVNRVTEHAKNGANFGVTLAQNSADRGRQSGDRSLNRLNAATTYARNMLDGMSRMAQNGIETRNNLRNRVRDSMTRGVQRGATLQTTGINALNTMATNGARTTSRLVDNAVGAMRSTTSLLRNPISALSATREAMRMSGDANMNINGPLGSFSFSYGQ